MATIQAIRQGIANNLSSLTDIQVSAYLLADPSPRTIQIMPGELSYDLAMQRGLDQYTMVVQGLAPLGVDVNSQQLLDDLIDAPNSVKTLIEADRTLGGIADDLRVTSCSGYQAVNVEGRGPMLICEWTVTVLAKSN